MASMVRSLSASLIMGACIYLLAFKILVGVLGQGVFSLAFGIFVVVCAGLAIFLISAKVLGSHELSYLTNLFKLSKKREQT